LASIQFQGVQRVFKQNDKEFVALKDIDFVVQDREFVAIVGPSGCGKTTCMRMAAGLEHPTGGHVRVANEIVTKPGPDRAVVFQAFALFPWKTVWDNIDFGLRSLGVEAGERRRRIEQIIALMGLGGYEQAFPHQLSGGMQQRVAIARAYVLDPKVLLMDEPFGALDALTRAHLQDELLKIVQRTQSTVVMVTHDVDEAVLLSDRIVMMTNGPAATIGEILAIDLPRPRNRVALAEDGRYVHYRKEVLDFLYTRHGQPQATAA
jgi:NitT/TauT family transport system ATP-binding protein